MDTKDPRDALLGAFDNVITDLLSGAASFNVKTTYDAEGRKVSTDYSLKRSIQIPTADELARGGVEASGAVEMIAGVPTMQPHAEDLRRAAERLNDALHMVASTPISADSKLEGLIAAARDVRTSLANTVRDALGSDPWVGAPLDS